ncbi:RNA-directed DNA polymerase from transposon BS, partial [Paramuricea clavata]
MVLEVAEAKLARTSAKRVFNRNVKKLVDSINSKDTAALIESRFKDLKQLWDDVQRKHEGYIESLENSKTTYDVEQEDGWIDEMDKVYDDVLRQKLAYFETVEEDQREIERQQEQISKEKEDQIRKKEGDKAIFRAEQARKVEEIAFRQEVENLEEALAAEIDKPNPAASMLETARTELKRQLEECKRVNGEYVLLLDAETAGYEIAWFTSLQKIYSQISKKIGDVIQRKSDTKGEAFDAIYNLDDDVTKMWKRLDEKYGLPSKLVDVVVCDIKNIKHLQEGDDQSFLELINTVEKGYQDLARINMESEISNSGTREWSREVNRSTSKVEQKNKFPYLLQFLQEQRKIIEYEPSELRTGGDHARKGRVHMIDRDGKFIEDKEATKTTRCLVHSSSTHNTADCRVYQEMAPEGKVQLLKEKRACWSCLKIGHRSIDCRQRKKCNSDDCSKYHHDSLHVAHVQGVAFHIPYFSRPNSDADGKESGTCLLQVMKIKSAVNAAPLNVLWDGGATISLITFAKARELSLDGEEIRLSVVKVGGVKEEMRSS